MIVSIIIPTFKRPGLLKKNWPSLKSVTLKHSVEYIYIINGDDQISKEFLESVQQENLHIHQIQATTPAKARNFAATKASGDYLLFLDDDVEIPLHYFDLAIKLIKEQNLQVFGGPEVLNKNPNFIQRAYSFCQGEPFITGHTFKRHRPFGSSLQLADESSLILCHLWVKKDLFLKNLFDERFFRNEENVFLSSLEDTEVYYHPNLWVYHFKKENIKNIFMATMSSGFFRAQSFRLYPDSFNAKFLVPLIFLIYLISLPLAQGDLYFIPLLVYLALIIFLGLKFLTTQLYLGTAIIIPFMICTIHLSYGLGMLKGLIKGFSHEARSQN